MPKASQKCQNCRRFSPEIETEIRRRRRSHQHHKCVNSEEILHYSNDQRRNFSISNHTCLIADLLLRCPVCCWRRRKLSCTKEFEFSTTEAADCLQVFASSLAIQALTSIQVLSVTRPPESLINEVIIRPGDHGQFTASHSWALKLHEFNLIISRNYIPRSRTFCVV